MRTNNNAVRRRPTMVDVARTAGVSVQTVSRVVNRAPKVSQRTAAHVQEVIDALGFQRNAAASSLRAGTSTATIGLITEDLSNPFYATIARAVERIARERDTLLITASSEEDPQQIRATVLDLCQRRVDGLLVVPTSGNNQDYLRAEINRGMPLVFLDRPARRIAADTILLDNLGGARAIVEHLLGEGHRRIGVIGAAGHIHTVEQRLDGYRQALAANNVNIDDNLIILGPLQPEQASAAAHDMLQLPDPPTALFTLNNRMTIGVLQQLTHWPEPVAVAGFDDFETAGLLTRPITVVHYDTEELGRRGAQLLFRRIDGWTGRPRRVILPTTLRHYQGISPHSDG